MSAGIRKVIRVSHKYELKMYMHANGVARLLCRFLLLLTSAMVWDLSSAATVGGNA